MVKPIDLQLVRAELFGHMKMLKKVSHHLDKPKWYFTNIPTNQKLVEILEGKWLNG